MTWKKGRSFKKLQRRKTENSKREYLGKEGEKGKKRLNLSVKKVRDLFLSSENWKYFFTKLPAERPLYNFSIKPCMKVAM